MGIADEAERTLFVGNLDSQVTEELLFELFLQAGPLIKVKIPRDNDGNSKQFAFVNFKHEVSVPYSMQLLSGIRLYGRQLNLKFRSGSSHTNQEKSPAYSQNPSPANTPTPYGARYDRTPDQTGSPSYSPPQNLQRSFSSPESLQKQAVMNNMWQMQSQQMLQLASSFQLGIQQQLRGGSSIPWQKDGPVHWNQRPTHQQDGGASSHYGREQRHRRDGHRSDFYQHDDRGGGRNRDYPPDRHRESRDRHWRRY